MSELSIHPSGLDWTMTQSRDRFRDALLGLAVGDALGTALEFSRPGTFEPIDDIVGGGLQATPVCLILKPANNRAKIEAIFVLCEYVTVCYHYKYG